MKKGAEGAVFLHRRLTRSGAESRRRLAPFVTTSALLLDKEYRMHRCLIACVITIVFWTQNGFAQSTAAPARTIQTAVLLSDPRGDSALIVTVPAGVVIELMGAQSGEWYQARTIGPVARAGWIHRTMIELLPAEAGSALPAAVAPSAGAAPETPR